MDERRRRAWLMAGALLMVGGAAAEWAIRPPGTHPPLPSSPQDLALRLEAHPTDWLAACAIAEKALDSRSPNRFALWHAAHAHALLLAPNRLEPQESFVRSGLFHWLELSPADRREVLAAIQPLLHDRTMFFALDRPLFYLTGDLKLLRRSQPHTAETLNELMTLAATNGRFDDYRSLRAELGARHLADFLSRLSSASPRELIEAFPSPPYRKDSETMIRALLQELHERPLDADPMRPEVLAGIIGYALRRDLGPLDGLELVVRKAASAPPQIRLRLARKLGISPSSVDPELARVPEEATQSSSEWKGLCDSDVCDRAWIDGSVSGPVVLTLTPTARDEVAPYVEIYADDALVAEGEVAGRSDFDLLVAPGERRVEVQLVNPLTRNNERRRVRVVSMRSSR